MTRPTEPLRCPVCGRRPVVTGYRIRCDVDTRYTTHVIAAESNDNLYAVKNWNALVRRILRRAAKQGAKP